MKVLGKGWFVAVFLILAVTLLFGCGPKIKTDEGEISFNNGKVEIKDNETGETVNIKDGKVEIKDDEGTSTLTIEEGKMELQDKDGNALFQTSESGGLSLPGGFPEDIIPIIGDSTIAMASKDGSTEEGEVYSISLQVQKEVEEVYKFYDDLLKGTQDYFSMKADPTYSMAGQKEDYIFSIIVRPGLKGEGTASVTMGVEHVVD